MSDFLSSFLLSDGQKANHKRCLQKGKQHLPDMVSKYLRKGHLRQVSVEGDENWLLSKIMIWPNRQASSRQQAKQASYPQEQGRGISSPKKKEDTKRAKREKHNNTHKPYARAHLRDEHELNHIP